MYIHDVYMENGYTCACTCTMLIYNCLIFLFPILVSFTPPSDSSESRLFFAADRLSLTINFLDISDEGVYKLTASNDAGSSYDSIELNIGCELLL